MDDLLRLVQIVYDAVTSKEWAIVVAAGVVALVGLARRYGGRFLPWLRSDRGGTALALMGTVAGTVLAGLLAGQQLSFTLLLHGLTAGFTAIGIYQGGKRLINPADKAAPPE